MQLNCSTYELRIVSCYYSRMPCCINAKWLVVLCERRLMEKVRQLVWTVCARHEAGSHKCFVHNGRWPLLLAWHLVCRSALHWNLVLTSLNSSSAVNWSVNFTGGIRSLSLHTIDCRVFDFLSRI